jgi:hypothetical protein
MFELLNYLFYICAIISNYLTYPYLIFAMTTVENITLKCTDYWFQMVLLYLATHVIMKEDIDVPIHTYNEKNTKNAIFAPFLIEKEQFAIPYSTKTMSASSKKTMPQSDSRPTFVALNIGIQPQPIPAFSDKKQVY